MQTRLALLRGTVNHEWRRLWRSPVWVIGLLAMSVLALSEAGVSPVLGYPSDTRCLYGFQLASSMLLGLVAFLLAAGSLAADIDSSRQDLVLSRPAPKWIYLAGKSLGVVSFSLLIAVVVMLVCAGSPLWHGHLRVHDLGPFVIVLGLCTVPMVCYVTALALFLTTLFRAVVITMPIMVLYFFAVVILNAGAAEHISYIDFSQRLYPRELLVEVPLRLSECTFAGLIAPLSGALVLRSAGYAAFALVLFLAANRALGCNFAGRLGAGVRGFLRAFKLRGISALDRDAGKAGTIRREEIRRRGIHRTRPDGLPVPVSRPRSISRLLANEACLFLYSVKLMAGRNLIAVGLLCMALILIVLTYRVGPFQTRAGVLLLNLEVFAPLLGIVLFSDLVAVEFERRRADLLRASSRGAAWLLLRRLVHAALLTAATCLLVLLVLRVVYTQFELVLALSAALPGAMFFGALGLLAAAIFRRSLVGYAAGTGALILALNLEQLQPLTPVSLHLREHLANSRLFGDANWLLAKAVFILLFLMLSVAATRLAQRPATWRSVLATAGALLIATVVTTRLLWSEPSNSALKAPASSRELSLVETNGVRLARRADITVRSRDPGGLRTACLLDVCSVQKAGGWQVERETPVDLTREVSLRHLDLDIAVDPSSAAVDAEARFAMRILAGTTGRLLFYLGAELDIHQLLVNERRVAYEKTGDLVEVTLEAPALPGDDLVLRVYYSGRLRLPQNLLFERATSDLLFVTTRFFPSLRPSDSTSRNLFTCRATVRTQRKYRVAAAAFLREEKGENVFLWESSAPVDCLPLFVGNFREYRGQHGATAISFCSFNRDAAYAKSALVTASAILGEFEAAFGSYPFPRLAIVEHRFQSAGGAAFPGLITIKPERLAPEHQQRFLDGYLPHEIAHGWWGNAFPRWIAEGGAVFSSVLFLERHRPGVAREFLEKEFREPFLSPSTSVEPLVTSSGPTAYSKGGYLFSMLRRVAGEPAVLESMKTFLFASAAAERYDPDSCTARMLEQLNRATPARWHPFIRAWTHGLERLDPVLSHLSQTPVGSEHEVALELTHRGKVRFPVPVRVTFRNGSVTDLCWASTNDTGTIHLRSSAPVVAAEIDPDFQLLDWDRRNNRLTLGEVRSQNSPAADRFVGWKTFTAADGLPGPDVRCFAFSPEGHLYAGVSSFSAAVNRQWAIARYDSEWQRYEPKAEPVSFVSSMAWAADRSFWLASQNHLRRMVDDDSSPWMTSKVPCGGDFGKRRFVSHSAGNPGLPGFRVYSLLVDADGRIWVATDGGLAVCDAAGTTTGDFKPVPALAGTEILALASLPVDGEGNAPVIYAATSRGLFFLDRNGWIPQPGFPGGLILSLAAAPDGKLWCGTFRSGLISICGKAVRSYSHRNSPVPDTIFSCLAADSASRLWCGTPDGLIRFDGQQWTRFTRDNSGLPSHRIHCVVCDPVGHVWIGTDAGVTLFDPVATRPSVPACRSVSPPRDRFPES